jgi:hypothetical protein
MNFLSCLSRMRRWGGGAHTVGIKSAICAFCDIEEVRPLRKVGEVEIQVIGFGQRVEVGGVEFEDIHCVEGAQGSHFGDLSGRNPPVLNVHKY